MCLPRIQSTGRQAKGTVEMNPKRSDAARRIVAAGFCPIACPALRLIAHWMPEGSPIIPSYANASRLLPTLTAVQSDAAEVGMALSQLLQIQDTLFVNLENVTYIEFRGQRRR
jgi:hypothetical protein